MLPALTGSVAICSLLLLLLYSGPAAAQSETSCDFSIVFPNSSWPNLGELLSGRLAYNDSPAEVGYSDYPTGHQLLWMTGTRTVWEATEAANTSYVYNSTADILGLVPVGNYTFFSNNTAGFPVLQFGARMFVPNEFFPDGAQVYLFWDNYIYRSGVADGLDLSGLLLYLSWGQVSTTYVAGSGSTGYVYTVYSNDGNTSIGNDLTDFSGFSDAAFNGQLQLSNCQSSAIGLALGDPQLIGFLGQRYQVHGMDQTVYNIISARQLQVNARLIFLASGHCPTRAGGEQATNCWSHPGSFFGSIAVQTAHGDRLLVTAGAAALGFSQVLLNGQPVPVGAETDADASLRLSLPAPYRLLLAVGIFKLELENSDSFINVLSVSVTSWTELTQSVRPHGLLGQTWQRPSQRGRDIPHIEGAVDDYAVMDNDLFGSSFVFNQFNAAAE